jgi:hypothetical protein
MTKKCVLHYSFLKKVKKINCGLYGYNKIKIAKTSRGRRSGGGKNAGGIRLHSLRPAFFYLSNRSVTSKIGVNIMFLLPVCFYSHPNLLFHSVVCYGGERQKFLPPPLRLPLLAYVSIIIM